MINRRHAWHQRLLRRLTVRPKAASDDHPRSAFAPPISGPSHPLVASAILYFLAASTALALGVWAPALVLALAGTTSLLCHGRHRTQAPQPS